MVIKQIYPEARLKYFRNCVTNTLLLHLSQHSFFKEGFYSFIVSVLLLGLTFKIYECCIYQDFGVFIKIHPKNYYRSLPYILSVFSFNKFFNALISSNKEIVAYHI